MESGSKVITLSRTVRGVSEAPLKVGYLLLKGESLTLDSAVRGSIMRDASAEISTFARYLGSCVATQVKDLPMPSKEMSQQEKRKVKGGGGGVPGRLRAGVVGPCDNK